MPALCGLDEAGLVCHGAREAAFLMAEELAFHELGRDRSAIDRHERAFAPRAGFVNHARHQLLAGAGLARDVHGRLAPGHLGDHRTHALQGRRFADQPVGGRIARHGRALELQGCGHELAQIGQVERLGDEVECAELQCADGGLDAAMGRDHGDRGPGHLALQPLDELEAVAVRQPHVGQAEVERLLVERQFRARDVEARAGRDVHALEGDRQELADMGFVVDDKGNGFHKDSSFGCQRFGSANTMRNALPPPGRG